MEFAYVIDQSNPTLRIDREKAQRRAMWASFGHFLARADRFILHYWPPDPDVEPLLAMGFQPEPTDVSPKARQLSGELTPELRRLLWGPGSGKGPWFKVELMRAGTLVYFIEEHESTAGWNCSQAELEELFAAGVDPAVVLDVAALRQRHQIKPSGPARALGPRRRNFTHTLGRPTRREWLDALRTVAARADRWALCWMEEPPGANGWCSDYGHDLMAPLAEETGGSDFPAHTRQMVGPLTPRALEILCGLPPHGLPDLEHQGPNQQPGDAQPAPWWWLLLLNGREVLLESQANGAEVRLALTPAEAAALDQPPDRLYDWALARRRQAVWQALWVPFYRGVRAAFPLGTTLPQFGISARYSELRFQGEPIASLTVEPDALDAMLASPDPGALLAGAPAPAHLLVEMAGESPRWRQLESPPPFAKPWDRQ